MGGFTFDRIVSARRISNRLNLGHLIGDHILRGIRNGRLFRKFRDGWLNRGCFYGRVCLSDRLFVSPFINGRFRHRRRQCRVGRLSHYFVRPTVLGRHIRRSCGLRRLRLGDRRFRRDINAFPGGLVLGQILIRHWHRQRKNGQSSNAQSRSVKQSLPKTRCHMSLLAPAGLDPPTRFAPSIADTIQGGNRPRAKALIMILLIDNYDSFTWNLVHYLGEAGAEVVVKRNDALTVDEALALDPDGIVISPGPCDPEQAGICLDLIRAASERQIPLLGVCLGHQAIGQAFGGKIVRADRILHGKVHEIIHDGTGVFADLPSPLKATRYHSLTVEPASLPNCLRVTATSGDGTIMGLIHEDLTIEGVQFHPESIASEHGHEMIRTFLARCKTKAAA